jgi:tetratricopeptide (TPR) repeat protein
MTTTHHDSPAGHDDATLASDDSPDDTVDGVNTAMLREKARGSLFGEYEAPKVDRFVILNKVGQGGMGEVFAAYDPQLDRQVAVKVLLRHGPPGETDADPQQARLLREARALARVTHPNVVSIFESGVTEGRLFLAMEFVQGETLGAWLKGSQRAWNEVLEVMKVAGHGLRAVHEAGLVHRDFKPENVMLVEDERRVLVMDFGLAIHESESEETWTPDENDKSGPHIPLDRLTKVGSAVGTPRYMPPEQYENADVDARADVFAFCVSLFEALYGAPPFGGGTVWNRLEQIRSGQIDLPERTEVPGWLGAVVRKGLAAEPADRWPSMDALLAALAPLQRPAWIARTVGGVALVGVVVGGLLGYQSYDLRERTAACEAEAAAIDAVWNGETAAAMHDGMGATGLVYAPAVAERVAPWIDQQAQAWRDAKMTACLSETVHEVWDRPKVAKAAFCLEDRRLQLQTVVFELTNADEHAVRGGVQAASGLSRVEPCTDDASLSAMPDPPPAELGPQVEEVRQKLARAEFLEIAGDYEGGLEVARGAREHAEGLEWMPLVAAARTREAIMLSGTGDFAGAEAAGLRAYIEAGTTGTWDVAVDAAIKLVAIVGQRQARYAEGKVWAEHARLAISHAKDPLELREGYRLNNVGNVHASAGEHEIAQELFERSLAIAENNLGPAHPKVASTLSNLGLSVDRTGDHERARALQQRALEVMETTLGPNHPEVGTALNNLGTASKETGDLVAARDYFERALALKETVLGPEHPEVAPLLNNLGSVFETEGDLERAKDHFERALAVFEQTLGPEHPNVAAALGNLGLLLSAMGQHEEGLVMLERALAIDEKVFGSDNPNVATSLNNVAAAYRDLGRYAEAKPMYQRATMLLENAMGADSPYVAYPLTGLGRVLSELGEHRAALEHLDRAMKLRADAPPKLVGQTQFALAVALWNAPASQGGDRDRALSLAQEGRDRVAQGGASLAGQLAQVDAWLAEHRR